MTAETASSVLALIIFSGIAYALVMRVHKGKWPKFRNPFYYDP